MLVIVSYIRNIACSCTADVYEDVPYIANYLYEHPGQVDLNLKGIWIADPSLSYNFVQEDIPALQFVQANRNVFPFNSTFMAQLQNMSDVCGYTDYLDEYAISHVITMHHSKACADT